MWLDFSVKDPDSVEFEMRIRMTLKEWKELQEQLEECKFASVGGRVSSKITSMVIKAQQYWWEERKRGKEV